MPIESGHRDHDATRAIEAREVGSDTLAITLTRRLLDNGAGTSELEQFLREAIARGRTRFQFHLGGLKYLNSTEIGALLRTAVLARGANGKISLHEANKKIRDVLVVAKVDGLFEMAN
ncbi:MAG: STAS domain-containing protein [Candidatus Eisenbacteria bacterium]